MSTIGREHEKLKTSVKEVRQRKKSKVFQKLVKWAFNKVDQNNSGAIEPNQLYSGLLLVHLRLATFLGPAACKPATKEYVDEIFILLDKDKNGVLDVEEFSYVVALLLPQIISRVIMLMVLTILLLPFLAKYILDSFNFLGRVTYFSMPSSVSEILKKLPPKVVAKLPKKITVALLKKVALPITLLKVDAYFNRLAAQEEKTEEEKKNK